jgi:hypothetical protein
MVDLLLIWPTSLSRPNKPFETGSIMSIRMPAILHHSWFDYLLNPNSMKIRIVCLTFIFLSRRFDERTYRFLETVHVRNNPEGLIQKSDMFCPP